MSQTCEAAPTGLATKRGIPTHNHPTAAANVSLAFWPYLSLGSLSVSVVGMQSCREGHCALYVLIAAVVVNENWQSCALSPNNRLCLAVSLRMQVSEHRSFPPLTIYSGIPLSEGFVTEVS